MNRLSCKVRMAGICVLFLGATAAAAAPKPIKLMFGKATKHKALKQFMDFRYVTLGDAFGPGKAWGWAAEGAPELSKIEKRRRRKPLEGWVFDNQRRATR